jgi:hypothetical protein
LQTKKQIEPKTYLRLYQGMIIFDSVRFLSKKNQTKIFFKKNTETKPKPVQND